MENYILTNQESFNLEHIFECGQCFRWNKEEDGSYTGVTNNSVINVKKEDTTIIFTGKSNGESFEHTIKEYFDLDTNYNDIKQILSQVDVYLEESIKFGNGIRILNQDFWETIISFII